MNVLEQKLPYTERDAISLLEVLDVSTGERQVLREFPYLMEAPNWLPSGEELLYNSGGRLWRFSLASGESTPVDTGFADHCNNDHVLGLGGTWLGISHATAEDNLSRVYTVPLSGGVPRLVTPMAPSYLHGWSPDGKTLVYTAGRNTWMDIYAIPAEGGEERRLTFTQGLSDGPEFSPDGRAIWFNSTRSGQMQIWRMDPQGQNLTRMTYLDDRNCWFPHLSPDGSQVAFLAYHAQGMDAFDHPAHKEVEIRLMSAQGGESRVLAQLFGGQGTINVNSWSPDGKRLAFVSYRLKEG